MLETVCLRSEIPSHAREWRNNPKIRQWCRQYTLIDRNQHEAWLSRISTDPSIKMFGVSVEETSEHGVRWYDIGVAGLTSINRVNQTAEFSLYIAPEYQKKGHGKSALIALLRHGFRDQNINCIWGETFDGNPAYQMFLNIGMRHEGTLRKRYFRDGKFIDAHIVSMLREEFTCP